MSKTPNESYKDNLKENTTKSYIESVKKFSSNNDNVTYLISTAISVILFIMMLIVVYTSKNNSNDPIIAIVLVSIFSFLIIYFLFYNYVSEFLKSAQKLKNVSIITIYILCLVFLFTVLSKEYSDQYAHIILPIILSIGFYLFYNAFSVNIDLEKSKDDYSIDFIRINYVYHFQSYYVRY
jgi:predicted membrane channel-forming protein YqfA (hemolysin III family)